MGTNSSCHTRGIIDSVTCEGYVPSWRIVWIAGSSSVSVASAPQHGAIAHLRWHITINDEAHTFPPHADNLLTLMLGIMAQNSHLDQRGSGLRGRESSAPGDIAHAPAPHCGPDDADSARRRNQNRYREPHR